MSDLDRPVKSSNLPSQFTNPTAQFIVASGASGREPMDTTIGYVAMAVEEAQSPADRLDAIEKVLGRIVDGYNDMEGSWSRTIALLVLSCKVEKLWRSDLDPSATRDMTEQDAFLYWVHEFLRSVGTKDALRSKIKHYVAENSDLEAIRKYSFEKAVTLSRYAKKFRALDATVPQEALALAENQSSTEQEVRIELEKGMAEAEARRSYVADPDGPSLDEAVEQARRNRELEMIAKIGRRGQPPRGNETLRGQMRDSTRGDPEALRRVLHTALDLVPEELDIGQDFWEFLHETANRCAFSGKSAGPGDPIEGHHVITRAQGDRRFVNIVPLCRSTHREIDNHGLSWVMAKYGLGEDQILVAAMTMTLAYIKWLEASRT